MDQGEELLANIFGVTNGGGGGRKVGRWGASIPDWLVLHVQTPKWPAFSMRYAPRISVGNWEVILTLAWRFVKDSISFLKR